MGVCREPRDGDCVVRGKRVGVDLDPMYRGLVNTVGETGARAASLVE